VAVIFNFQIGCEEAHIIIYNCPFYRNRVFENKNFTYEYDRDEGLGVYCLMFVWVSEKFA